MFASLRPTWEVIHEDLLAAATDVIADNSAMSNARIALAFTVASQISDGMLVFYWDRIVSGVPGCGAGMTGVVSTRRGSEPSNEALQAASARLAAVASASATPLPVRNAAGCALLFTRGRLDQRPGR
ncbi:MAG: hypothetical protein K2X99_01385 [Gemmatimonadaceae bacterium]|nr:hypothetical protein [Gemmatimonadaceae bacterium]